MYCSSSRTDLALELLKEVKDENLSGVKCDEKSENGFKVTSIQILDNNGEKALKKPKGNYITLEIDGLIRREENAFSAACNILAENIRKLIPASGTALIAGLGNRAITPDAIGPQTLDYVMVTRHLRQQLPEYFSSFRPVIAICSGVLGTTGLESAELISAVSSSQHPDFIIAVDALAARSPDRLCRTVQLSDTGIIPGSGVGNARKELTKNSLGVPVIAIGVPTVIEAGRFSGGGDLGMVVTPRDIDAKVKDVSKLLGYSINLALHDGIGLSDVDMLVS